MLPLVSIIIPSFNSAGTIEKTLETACGQTWLNLEVILVDDGSSDGTPEIAESFSSERLNVVRQKNQGAPVARNFGIELARGDYVQFLDSDDLLCTNKIADQMDRLLSLPDGYVAYGPWNYVDAAGAFAGAGVASGRDFSPGIRLLLASLESGFFIPSHSWLVPRRVLESAGPWDTRLIQNQDGEYFSRILENATGAAWVEGATCYYRRRGNGTLSQRQSAAADDSLLLAADLIAKRLLFSGIMDGKKFASAIYLRTLCRVGAGSKIRGDLWKNAVACGLPSRRIRCGGFLFRCVYRMFGWKAAFQCKMMAVRFLRIIGVNRRR